MDVAERKKKYRYIREDDNYTGVCQCAIKTSCSGCVLYRVETHYNGQDMTGVRERYYEQIERQKKLIMR